MNLKVIDGVLCLSGTSIEPKPHHKRLKRGSRLVESDTGKVYVYKQKKWLMLTEED